MKSNASVFKLNQQRFLNTVALVFLLVAILISIKNYYNPLIYGLKNTPFGVKAYNNFVIFKNSFIHLLDQKQLFHPYRPEQYDVFKYSPTFALFFGFFSWGSDLIGLILWNSLNVLLPLFAIQRIWNHFQIPNSKIVYVLTLALLLESATSALNSQSNGLMLGLMLLTVIAIQKNQFSKAIIFIALSTFIKIFGLVLFSLFLIKPGISSWRKLLFTTLTVFALLFLIPLIVVDGNYLLQQYQEWLRLLRNDSSVFVKYSVMGWMISWFSLTPSKTLILILGLITQFAPILLLFINKFIRFAQFSSNRFAQIHPNKRAPFAAGFSQLLSRGIIYQYPSKFLEIWAFTWIIWVVIFNHMAESATFIIAVGGIIAYLRIIPEWNKWIQIQLILLFAFTILGPTDIYPPTWRFWIVDTAQLKVFPVILFWGTMILNLIKMGNSQRSIVQQIK
jgi:hypothetical protein